jgi:hypothetical protein
MTVRTSTNRRVVCLALVAIVAGVSLAARQEVTLRYSWPKGETLRYRVTQQTTTTLSGMPGAPGDVSLDQSTLQVIRNVAKDVAADGTTTLDQTLESVKMEINTPVGKMGYDSAKPAPPGNPGEEMLAKMFSAMVNASFTVTMAPTGVIQKVEGVSKLGEKILAGLPQNAQAEQMLGGLKATLSDDGMKATLTQGFPQMPEKPVKPGETWKGSFDMRNDGIGRIIFSNESTLKDVQGSIATIQSKMTIAQDPKVPASAPMGLKLTLGAASGQMEMAFDTAKGRIQKAVTQFVMPMTMSGAAPDGTTLNLQNNAKTTLTIELVQ